MHHIQDGAAEKSYGIAVAKLAGLPTAALKSARRHLAALEEQAADRQLNLFATADNDANDDDSDDNPAHHATIPHPIAEKLHAINPDDLTARAALDLVYELKQLADKAA